jgi:hypothetical protein
LIRAQFRTRVPRRCCRCWRSPSGVALGYAIHLINDAALADFRDAR